MTMHEPDQPTTSSTAPLFHPAAWGAWLCAALVAITLTRNPLYLVLILLCLLIVDRALQNHTPDAVPLLMSPVHFTLLVMVLSGLFNMLTTHQGRTVLFRIPLFLPLLGGPVTLEAWGFGAINGLVISCLFAAFTILNKALPIHTIIRFIPRAFYPLAVVTSIAITFVPTTLRQLQHIREAQAVRGHRLRGLRDWLPLFLPLLIGGLERALQLAEAMTARGFASTSNPNDQIRTRAIVVVGLVLLFGGLLMRTVWGYGTASLAMIAPGALLIPVALWLAGQSVSHTTYRRERWSGRDAWGIAGAVLTLIIFTGLLPGIGLQAFSYSPYPRIAIPDFKPVVVIGVGGLLIPAILLMMNNE